MDELELTIQRILDLQQRGRKDYDQAADLLESGYRTLTPEGQSHFLDALRGYLNESPLSGAALPKFTVHGAIIKTWARCLPTEELGPSVFALIRWDSPSVIEGWVSHVYPPFRAALWENAHRFSNSSLDSISSCCATYTTLQSELITARQFPESLVNAVKGIEGVIQDIHDAKFERDLVNQVKLSGGSSQLDPIPMKQHLKKIWNDPVFSKIIAAVIIGAGGVLVGSWLLPHQTTTPSSVEEHPAPDTPQVPEETSRVPKPKDESGTATTKKQADTRKEIPKTETAPPARDTPFPAAAVAPPPVIVAPPNDRLQTCDMIAPDRAPNVVLQPGDLVFVVDGTLSRLDQKRNTQRILIADALANTRGIAVESTGTVLVSTRACGAGAILRIDTRTGQQTIVAMGFRGPKAILLEPSGTLLVADEVGQTPTWGYLWRINLKTGEKEALYQFTPTEVATGLGIDARTGDIFFTRQGLYRLTRDGVRRIEVDGVLKPIVMTMTAGNLLITDGGPKVAEVRPTGEIVAMNAGGGPITNLAVRGNQIFVGYGNGRVGRIRETDHEAENIWEGGVSSVFLAIVPDPAAVKR